MHQLTPPPPAQPSSRTETRPVHFSAVPRFERTHVSAPAKLSARWIESADELEALENSWDELVRHALWQNLALEPNYLIPAFRYLQQDRVKVLVVESVGPAQDREIMALVPIISRRVYGLPISAAAVWKHDQCFDGTPLIRKAGAFQTMCFLLKFLSESYGLLCLDWVRAEGEFCELFDRATREQQLGVFQREQFSRASFTPATSAQDYAAQFVSRNIQKNVKRLKRRLAEIGDVSFELAESHADFDRLAEEFMRIEASGWKGRAQTALQCQIATRRFYENLIRRSARVGKARFLSLLLDGKPIAMLSDLESNGVAYSYKTAFDDQFAGYSPGLQLELENIHYLHQSKVHLADSCTSSDNSTINRIWGQRMKYQSLVIGLRSGWPQLATRMLPRARSVVQMAKSCCRISKKRLTN